MSNFKGDVGDKIKIVKGDHKGKIAEVLSLRGYGSLSCFGPVEPAYDVLIEESNIRVQLHSNEVEFFSS